MIHLDRDDVFSGMDCGGDIYNRGETGSGPGAGRLSIDEDQRLSVAAEDRDRAANPAAVGDGEILAEIAGTGEFSGLCLRSVPDPAGARQGKILAAGIAVIGG